MSAISRRQNVFVKASGDMCQNAQFHAWIKDLSQTAWVVICVGAGTQINEEFQQRGLPVEKHGPLGREIPTFEGRQLARDVLERNQRDLEDQLSAEGAHVSVAVPAFEIGTVLCHLNGDEMVRVAYLGFDDLYVVTTPERAKAKEKQFRGLPKVSIVTF